jgi:hypothetical protein
LGAPIIIFNQGTSGLKRGGEIYASNSEIPSPLTMVYPKPSGKRTHRRYPTITNLDPNCLRRDEILDLSHKRWPVLGFSTSDFRSSTSKKQMLAYGTSKGTGYPYPPNSKGWLYFHRRPDSHPLAGELRFRTLSGGSLSNLAHNSDLKKLFAEGMDLRSIDHTIWRVPLLHLYRLHKPIYNLLVSQNLISSSLHLDIERWVPAAYQFGRKMTLIEKITDPFLVDFSLTYHRFYILQEEGIRYFRWSYPFIDRRIPRASPYSGEPISFSRPFAHDVL